MVAVWAGHDEWQIECSVEPQMGEVGCSYRQRKRMIGKTQSVAVRYQRHFCDVQMYTDVSPLVIVKI